jgi:histidinol dehydrogenase
MIKIIKLTAITEKALFKARESEDREAFVVAARIVDDVRRRDDAAVESWSRKLDRIDLRRDSLWITPREFAAAEKSVNPQFVGALEHAARNIRRVAEQQKPRDWNLEVERGVTVQQIIRPLESIGCYIPGGRFALVSTLLMTVIPAQVAGVREIVAVCPRPNDELLVAANFLGLTRLARIGGAQAIAAMAYGTKRIPQVQKLFGPGNRFVTAAKQIVSNHCAIDVPAGPTEAIVLAERGNAKWIAADLLAQAEHAPDAGSFLVTTSQELAKSVAAEVEQQLKTFSPNNAAHASFRQTSAILVANSMPQAIAFVNHFAPEHLSLPEKDSAVLRKIENAGTIFLGPLSAQPFGDYASGSNHVLPTGGWARRRGGLSTNDFVKRVTVQTIEAAGYKGLANDVTILANAEGLEAHVNAIEVRR